MFFPAARLCVVDLTRISSSGIHTTARTRGFHSSRAIFDATPTAAAIETSLTEIERIYILQRSHEYAVAKSTAQERKAKLQNVLDVFLAHREEIRDAAFQDKGNNHSETDLTEVFSTTSELKHVRDNVSKWIKPRRVPTPLAFFGSRSWIHYEPKGVCLIISPWNFPFNLSFAPLFSAVAAGNTAIIKPSEMTPHCSAVIRKIVGKVFHENEVAVVEGAVQTSQSLLKQKFDHIFFTGSPALGKVVMEAASKHLASVTLELGGKNPVIIDETANIDTAAKRIAWAKTLNSGQICIAPDHIYVHQSKKDEFLAKYVEHVKGMFGEDAKKSQCYSRIVNDQHHARIQNLVTGAKEQGANLEYGGSACYVQEKYYFEPTVLTNPDPNSKVMQEEIFGPVLPVITYKSIEEPIAAINTGEKPLVLYIFSSTDASAQHVIDSTRAGATVINHCLIHYLNKNLPFGGSNNSGIGKSGGFSGFREFTNERAVVQQVAPLSSIELMMPPYTNLKQKLIDLAIKLF